MNSLLSSSSSPHSTMNSTNASSSNPSKKIKLTIILPRQLFVNISSDEDITTTPSPTTTSSSPTPPNAPSKTTSTNQTSSSQENTSSSFHSKLQISPPSSHAPASPHHLNPLLDNILYVPSRPLNPQPLQSHPSLDIILSLSPITPLDHIHDTQSPPSQPQPQPPIMGHPLFYNYHDYHGSDSVDLPSPLLQSAKEKNTRNLPSKRSVSFCLLQSRMSNTSDKGTTFGDGAARVGMQLRSSLKVSTTSPLVSPSTIINVPRELYSIDVAATFGVPLTIVGDLQKLINDIDEAKLLSSWGLTTLSTTTF
ncbi:hypothetical protein Tco_0154074 [Tanacetum coccineum]